MNHTLGTTGCFVGLTSQIYLTNNDVVYGWALLGLLNSSWWAQLIWEQLSWTIFPTILTTDISLLKWEHCGIGFCGYKMIEGFFIPRHFKWTVLKNQMSLRRHVPSHKCSPLKNTISFVLNNLMSHEHLHVRFQWPHIHFFKRWFGGCWEAPQTSKQQTSCSHRDLFPFGW